MDTENLDSLIVEAIKNNKEEKKKSLYNTGGSEEKGKAGSIN